MTKKTLAEAGKEIFDQSVKSGYRDAPKAIKDPNEDDTGAPIVHPLDKGKVYDKDVKKDKSSPVKNADSGDLNKSLKLTKVSEEDEEDLNDEFIDEEILNELSADTLKNYIRKNVNNNVELDRSLRKLKKGAGRPSAEKNAKMNALQGKIAHRDYGLAKAVSRLGVKSGPKGPWKHVNEALNEMDDDELFENLDALLYNEDGELNEDVLNELSTDTLRRYLRNNAHSRVELATKRDSVLKGAGRPTFKQSKKIKNIDRKIYNRQGGQITALNKMGKVAGRRATAEEIDNEELEIVEDRFQLSPKLAAIFEAYEDEDKVSVDGEDINNQNQNVKPNGDENVEGTKKLSAKGSKAQIIINIGESLDMSAGKEFDPLFEDQDELTEEFKDKVRTIFEAAVGRRVAKLAEEIVVDANEQFNSEVERIEEELSENVLDFLKLVARDWLVENQVNLEYNLKMEIMEDLLNGFKKLFEDNYIDIPEDKYDVIKEMAATNEELEESLNREIAEKIENSKYIKELEAKIVFNDIMNENKNLTVSQVDNIRELSENIEFNDIDEYSKKLNFIIETYVVGEKKISSKKSSSFIKEELITNDVNEDSIVVVDNDVKAVLSALKIAKK